MNAIKNIKNYLGNNKKSYGKKFIIPLMMVLSSISKEAISENKKDILAGIYWNEISAAIKNPEIDATNLEVYFQSNEVPEKYLENNLFINGKAITNQEFNHSITEIWKDKFEVKYLHPLEGIEKFSQPSTKEITIKVKFAYKDNNIFIEFEDISIKWNKLSDNSTLVSDNTVYDYDINQWENKSIEINCKANIYKTNEMINDKIENTKISFTSKIDKIKEFENTQLTQLDSISLWKEVMKEGEFYYREVCITESWKYRPITKIYFDKYGKIDKSKTEWEVKKKNNLVVLCVNVELNFRENNDLLELSITDESIKKLQEKISEHRRSIINLIDKAKVWPNTEFVWFNKNKSKRNWSKNEEWLFNTELVSLELIDDTYVFQRWDEAQSIYFGIEKKEWLDDAIYLKNKNNQKVEEYFITIDNNEYSISLNKNELSINKIKKSWENIENNLPIFSWNKDMISIITAEGINIYYNSTKKQLNYYMSDWKLITSIPCEKSEKWEYKLNKASTNIDVKDLFNTPEFATTIEEIKSIQKELNTLDVDILNSFQILLTNNWIKLTTQDLIKITNNEWNTYYCNIESTKYWFEIVKNEKLYNTSLKILKNIKSRLEIVKKLNNTEIRWVNNGKKENFKQFVWWWWGIGTRFISQNNIIQFISQSTNEIKLELLWWEWQITNIIYDISPRSWKIKLEWKSTVIISWQSYKLKINEKWEVFLDPIESK